MARRDILAVTFLAALLSLPFLSLTPFFTHGEAREALSSQSMLKTHNWILPNRYGDEIATKPPFMYWLVTIFSLPQGEVSEFTARLPGALFGILAVYGLFRFVSKGWDSHLALLACLFLIGSGVWLMETVSARLDLTLSALLFMGFCALYFWEERKLEGLPFLPILLLTAATLTKGPVAIALPAAILFGYLLILRYRLSAIVVALCKVFVPVICLSSVWYFLAYRAGEQAFLNLVLSENLERLTSTMEKPTHVQTIGYLYGTLLIGLLPGSILLLFFLADAFRWLRRASFDRIRTGLARLNAANLRKIPKAHLYSCIVVICVLALFSVPSSKRPAYLLPIYPFVCILLAICARKLISRNSVALRRLCAAFLGLVVLQYGIVFVFLSHWDNPHIFLRRAESLIRYKFFEHAFRQSLGTMSVIESVVFILPLALSLALIFLPRKSAGLRLERFAAASYGAYLAILMVVNGIILPTVGTALTPKFYAQSLAPPDASAEIYSFREQFYEINFYLGNRLRLYDEEEKLQDINYFLVTDDKHFGDFIKAFERDFKVEVLRRSPLDAVTNPRPRIALVKLTRLRL